ncbi:hypothetical protein NDU88_003024 [Pleurodeles waltl]|uniref:Uncharacterized protein n=1 Tax=Pleurodeles waltl TaxID=8319 RepID=A0AAV7MT36_PLEWA|nr:hypothetical protein NDU88_003024 [Pleurodeles waltl]
MHLQETARIQLAIRTVSASTPDSKRIRDEKKAHCGFRGRAGRYRSPTHRQFIVPGPQRYALDTNKM